MSKPYVNYQSVSPDALHNLLKIHGPTFQGFTESTIEFEKLSLRGVWVPKAYQERALESTKVTFVEVDGCLALTSYPVCDTYSTFLAAKFDIGESYEPDGDGKIPESGVIEFWGAGSTALAELYDGKLHEYRGNYWLAFNSMAEFVEQYSKLKLLRSKPEVATVVLSYMFTETPGWAGGVQGEFYLDGEWFEFAATGNLTTTIQQKMYHFFEGSGGIPFNVMMKTDAFESEVADEICERMSEEGQTEFIYRNLRPILKHARTGKVQYKAFSVEDREYYDIVTQDRNYTLELEG
ncbi:hypothetical protein SM033_00020 [Vibrio phage vB_VpaM_sm033]|nr:hypothetical protein SM033_00020 [Vibrio phage vB_VpaM_sm033]